MLDMSGSVFSSGRRALNKPSDLYILGQNPAGDPFGSHTIRRNLEAVRSLDFVSGLPPGPLTAGRRIREACGSLDNASQSVLETLFPTVDPETLTELCKPFERDWSDPATP